jgi:hypothetical protein
MAEILAVFPGFYTPISSKMPKKKGSAIKGVGERGDQGRKWSRYDHQKAMTYLLFIIRSCASLF